MQNLQGRIQIRIRTDRINMCQQHRKAELHMMRDVLEYGFMEETCSCI